MALLTSWLVAAAALDRYGRRRELAGGPWDAIVVAGCHVRPDGLPSLALARRVERAVELYDEGLSDRIVLTGGVGPHPPAEAVAAARYAVTLGVPADALLVEDRSLSTEENARFTRELLDARRVLVVTDSYHVLRCERVFGRYFEEALGQGAISPARSRIAGALREVFALSWYAVKGRLSLSPRR